MGRFTLPGARLEGESRRMIAVEVQSKTTVAADGGRKR
jgi:hypothetical protein